MAQQFVATIRKSRKCAEYTSPVFDTREAAALDAFRARAGAGTVVTCVAGPDGQPTGSDIRFADRWMFSNELAAQGV